MEIDRELLCQLEEQGRLRVFSDKGIGIKDVYLTSYIQRNVLMLFGVLEVIIWFRDYYPSTAKEVYKGVQFSHISVDSEVNSLGYLLDFYKHVVKHYPHEHLSALLFINSLSAKLSVINSTSSEELLMNFDTLYADNIKVFSSYLPIIKYTQDLSKNISEKNISIRTENSYISYFIDNAPSLVPARIETRNSTVKIHCNNTPFTLEAFLKCCTSNMSQGSLAGRYQGGCELQDPLDCSIQEKNIVFLHILDTITENQKEALNHLLYKKYNGHYLMGINYIPGKNLNKLAAHVEQEIRGVSSLSLYYSLIEMSNSENLQASVTYASNHLDGKWNLSLPIPVILSESSEKNLVPGLIKVLEANINLDPRSYLISTPVCSERDRLVSSYISNVSVWYR